MINEPELKRFLSVSLPVEAIMNGGKLRVSDLLALRIGSVVPTGASAGENVTVLAGDSRLGIGELAISNRRVSVRMLRFRGDN